MNQPLRLFNLSFSLTNAEIISAEIAFTGRFIQTFSNLHTFTNLYAIYKNISLYRITQGVLARIDGVPVNPSLTSLNYHIDGIHPSHDVSSTISLNGGQSDLRQSSISCTNIPPLIECEYILTIPEKSFFSCGYNFVYNGVSTGQEVWTEVRYVLFFAGELIGT